MPDKEDVDNLEELCRYGLAWLEIVENGIREMDAEISRLRGIEKAALEAKSRAVELARLMEGI